MKLFGASIPFSFGRDNVTAYQSFFIIRYITSALLSVVLVRSALPIEVISIFEMWLFFTTILTAFWSNGIKNGILAMYHVKDPVGRHELILSVYLLLQFLSAVLSLTLLFFSDEFWNLATGKSELPGVNWLIIYIFFSVPGILTENVLYLKEKTAMQLQYAVWSSAGQLLGICFCVWYFTDVVSLFAVLACWSIVKWLYLVSILPWNAFGKAVWQGVFPFFKYCIPLILLMLLGTGMEMMDGLLVTHFYPLSDFPIYKYGARELPFSALLFSSLGAAMIPLIQREEADKMEVKQRVTRLMHWLFPLSILLVWVSKPIFTLVYGTYFADSGTIFAIYMAIISSRVLLPQIYQQAYHQHGILIISSVVELVANLLLSLWWMKYWGIFGLVSATVVAYGIQKVVLIIHNWLKNGIAPSAYIDLKIYGGYMLLLVFSLFIHFVI